MLGSVQKQQCRNWNHSPSHHSEAGHSKTSGFPEALAWLSHSALSATASAGADMPMVGNDTLYMIFLTESCGSSELGAKGQQTPREQHRYCDTNPCCILHTLWKAAQMLLFASASIKQGICDHQH